MRKATIAEELGMLEVPIEPDLNELLDVGFSKLGDWDKVRVPRGVRT